MAGSAADDHQPLPPPPPKAEREIEEGEVVSGYRAGTGSDTDTDDEDARYYLQSRHDDDLWVNVVSAGSARGGNGSPAASVGSDCTVSDVDAGVIVAGDAAAAGAVTVARAGDDVPLPVFPCGVCRREFRCSKAVHGHMRVHAQAPKEEKQVVADAFVSGAAVEEVAESVSVAIAAIPRLSDDTITSVQSVVHGGSGSSSSARSSVELSATGQSAANVVAAPAPPAAAPEQVPVAPQPAPPQQASVVPASPQQATVVPPPAVAAPEHLNPLQLQLAVLSDPSTSAGHPAPAGSSQTGFSCRECNKWFPTHQGLGGHVAGHKNRRIALATAAAAAAGIDPQDHMACRGGARPVKSHACKVCGQVYPSGVSLGGHMRKHYGKPIVPRKKLRLLGAPDLALAPPLQLSAPSSSMQAPIAAQPLASYEPAAAPVVEAAAQPPQPPLLPPGSVRIFGVTIMQKPKEEVEEPPVEEAPVDEPMNE